VEPVILLTFKDKAARLFLKLNNTMGHDKTIQQARCKSYIAARLALYMGTALAKQNYTQVYEHRSHLIVSSYPPASSRCKKNVLSSFRVGG
jgi:DhnA family fructose-bisphosphate aldolase class Ia